MLKRRKILVLLAMLFFLLPFSAMATDLPPIVSTEELAAALTNPDLVVVDIRKVEEYKAGHIPGAISVFYGTLAITRADNANELPMDDDLIDTIGSAGIKPDSIVVIYGKTDTPPERVNITRAAWTLKYAGVEKVSVMNGGFEKWSIREKRPVSTEMEKPKSVSFKGKFNKTILADKDYVWKSLGSKGMILIVDVREPDFFDGQQKLPFVAKAGRIAGAVNLPSMQVFEKYPPGDHMEMCCWTFKDTDTLRNMATGVVGLDPTREIIVYCDTGRVASTWWYILSQVLGYKNVKLYDGSMQEWSKDDNAPMLP
ncbi:MAG: sulfurtransferase [Syntrophaceae bacterium]|nr:sulfurtransferase [Syntrophaceae bacterium]